MRNAADLEKAVTGALRPPALADKLKIRELGADERHKLVHSGHMALLPLWGHGSDVVALVALPQTPAEEWWPVVLSNGQAVTLASSILTLVPQFMMRQLFAKRPGALERLASDWRSLRAPLMGLHEELGGRSDTLLVVDDAICDPNSRARFAYDARNKPDFQRAMSKLGRSIEPSKAFKAFADWIDAAVEGDLKPPSPEKMGRWGRLCVAWAQTLLERTVDPQEPTAEMIDIIEAFAGIDTGIAGLASWTMQITGNGKATAVSLASTIRKDRALGDEIASVLTKALVSERLQYKGLAHAEATPLLDERGEPERAWGILNSAAWWMAQNADEVPQAVLDGARMLCDEHGWHDIRWVIDRNVEAAA